MPVLKNDKDGVTLAMIVAATLAGSKHIGLLPEHIKWQLNAYTNWNVSMLLIRWLFNVEEWDTFLCVNSIGIYLGFRTSFANGLDDNIRKKIKSMGLDLSRKQFLFGDFIVHTLPAILTTATLVQNKKRIPRISLTYALTLSTWFVFSQVGKLDASDIYVPHPWKRGWFGVLTGMLAAPQLVDSLQSNKKGKLLLVILSMIIPYLTTSLDKELTKKYGFEYNLNRLKKQKKEFSKTSSEPSFLDVRQ